MIDFCGARTSDGPCQETPEPGKKRCRDHGGMSRGPHVPDKPYGNARHLAHGVYSKKGIFPSEVADLPEIANIRGIDGELCMLRVLLARTYAGELAYDTRLRMEIGTRGESPVEPWHLPVVSIENAETPAGPSEKVVRTATGYIDRILKLTKMITKLEIARHTMEIERREGRIDRVNRVKDYLVHHGLPGFDAASFDLSPEDRADADAQIDDMAAFGEAAWKTLPGSGVPE